MKSFVLKKQGFTFIELLVTIGIIAILAGIIIPILNMARHKAQHILCVNNMRQLFIAFEQYANDNNGFLPRPNNSDTSKDGTKNCIGEVWFKAVDNYLSALQLSSKRDEILLEERLMFVKQDPVFKTVPISEQDATRTIKMNQNLVPASECQRSIETIENPDKITDSLKDEETKYYYKYYKNLPSSYRFMRVIAKYLNGEGFIISSHLMKAIQ